MEPTDPCPGCGHSLAFYVHTSELGCTYGWISGPDDYPVIAEGCSCTLTLARDALARKELAYALRERADNSNHVDWDSSLGQLLSEAADVLEGKEDQEKLVEVFKAAWGLADARGDIGKRTEYGIAAVLAALGRYPR